ncbi:MAG: hypothetical protein IKO80_08790 [Lachnospiraceae bacterium]|nr:hypothetical protein [Lachnospiraceae bacterium]
MRSFLQEYRAIDDELSELHKQLETYPKGSLRKRTIKGCEYYYLQYRDGKHVRSDYVRADQVAGMRDLIEERKKLEQRTRDLQTRVESYAVLLGIHRSYRPVRNVDYEDYTLFMSMVAHDYKTMETDEFIRKYAVSRYRGINKRYIAGFLDHINGIDRRNTRRTNDLVLDPYTYLMYFKYGDKDVLEQEMKKAIPAFLNRGLLITSVQEAVRGASC